MVIGRWSSDEEWLVCRILREHILFCDISRYSLSTHVKHIFFYNQCLSGSNRIKRTWILSHRMMHFLNLCEELNIIKFLRLQLIFNKRVSLSSAFLHKKVSYQWTQDAGRCVIKLHAKIYFN